LQSLSGDTVPSSHLAVSLTSRTKGAKLLNEIINEKFLVAHAPSKKATYCMVTKAEVGKEGGEPVGTILYVTASSKKKRYVSVVRVDGSAAKEAELPWERVIEVEVAH
jgi:hypothetical protein